MRTWITLLLACCLLVITTAGFAGDLDANGKPTGHILANPAADGRQGGETVETAVFVELPYSDTGATCDNLDDYDAICPYPGSTSPDVVYAFVAPEDGHVSVDMCGSQYDTKVFMFDADLNVIGCDDDYYTGPPCGTYVSYLAQVEVWEGQTYYVVVDGYGGDCGEYYIGIGYDCIPPPCLDAQCPDTAQQEGEPPLVIGYIDQFNGGCDSENVVFQELYLPPGQDQLDFCGNTGWYWRDEQEYRDTDWLQLVAAGDLIHVAGMSSHFQPIDCDVLFMQDCQNISTLPVDIGICDQGEIDIPTTPGQVVHLRIRPMFPYREGCAPASDLYHLEITGIEAVVGTEATSWGGLKSLYR